MAKRKAKNRQRRSARSSHSTGNGGLTPNKIGIGIGGLLALVVIVVVLVMSLSTKDESVLTQAQAEHLHDEISAEDAFVGIGTGDKIPDFGFQLNDGSIVSTASLVEQGKPTFLFFFATW